MDRDNVLKRQLRRGGLSEDTIPNLEQWKAFVESVDRTYKGFDQERYLLERSMQISSRETTELNEKLEQAQQIAHLGYWFYDRESGVITFSKEMYRMWGIPTGMPMPGLDDFMIRINEGERNKLSSLIERAFTSGESYNIEAKIKTFANETRWCFFAGKPHPTHDNNPIRHLSGIALDITERKIAEEENHQLNQQLIASARRAGMSEVATSVLHNVGNILNSVSVSVGTLKRYIDEVDLQSIIAVIEMLSEHKNNLPNFLTTDSKGKLIFDFFEEAKNHINKKSIEIDTELVRLHDNIKHISDIVSIQGTISGNSGIKEEIKLNDIINYVIDLNFESMEKKGIALEKAFADNFTFISDKTKIMQILVNLIQNAKDSVLASDPKKEKKVSLYTKKQDNADYVDVIVQDSGIGIDKSNLTRIFAFGFTTKAKGHGFGLHSSALLAKELGGQLRAESDGLGLGATFILTLPLVTTKERSKAHV